MQNRSIFIYLFIFLISYVYLFNLEKLPILCVTGTWIYTK